MKEFKACGADSITFHLEATDDAEETIDLIRNLGCRVGMSIKPKTPVEAVRKYLPKLDMLLGDDGGAGIRRSEIHPRIDGAHPQNTGDG